MAYISVEGLPAVGKSELLAALRLYYPGQVLVLPELVKETAEREGLDLFRDRDRLAQAMLAALPARQGQIRAALNQSLTVVEESHLAVHAAYAASLGDDAFLRQFQRAEQAILWPDRFVRLEVPIAVSVARQAARGDPRYTVPADVLARMLGWLSAWHAQRGSDLHVLDADRPPHAVLADLVSALGLGYRPHVYQDVIPYLFLLGRPASGKSELIQFLTSLPPDERAVAYHLGRLRVLDDFPILWQKFVEDDLWEEVGKGRLVSRRCGENYAVADDHAWPFLILSLNQEISRRPPAPGETALVEFSRGGTRGYRDALARLAPEVLASGAILYLQVSFEESWRRNVARYDRARRDGLLTHSVPREEMERTYRSDDWTELAPTPRGHVEAQGIRVPYVTVVNEPEPKTPDDFARRFHPALEDLHRLWQRR
ncbi:MAG: hypothetical protein NUV94_00330 [Candidatus Acetothermia bacterium]|jgi:thymidylate kinase|nr:hypothetical protein [Candidatus Acetothermia bacterium]